MSDDIHIFVAPEGRRLEQGPEQPKGYVGRPGGDGLEARADRVEIARKHWREARAADFERVGQRTWRESASGVEYHHQRGNALLGAGTPEEAGVACFLIVDDVLVFLEESTGPRVTKTIALGTVAGRRAGMRERF